MKSLMVGLALLIITTVTWACVHINIADGDLQADKETSAIHAEDSDPDSE